jgi:Di-haem oxidoreductase, putative peroxidase
MMISIFRALAVPYLSENFVIYACGMNWGSCRFTTGVSEMAKRTFAYACSLASLTTILVASVSLPSLAPAQTRGPSDPGVRGGAAGAGDAITGLSPEEGAFFKAAKQVFGETETVADGLGPRFNLDSCGGCHIQPNLGGSSPPLNPQVAVAQAAKNTVPSFITANGPVREARFVRNPDGTPDGGVHALFVITGRSDAGGCNIQQPNFAAAVANNNVIFRIPTPTFGLGLVEATTDAALRASMAANSQQKRSLGISGRFNTNGNDGTITRFGWKAQNKSLLIFSGEAYNVEMGVTNELFPQEREENPGCATNALPESPTPVISDAELTAISPASGYQSDAILFAAFMRLLAPPTPAGAAPAAAAATSSSGTSTVVASASSVLPAAAGTATTASRTGGGSSSTTSTVARGQQVFSNVGCAACHNRSLTSGKSSTAALTNVPYQPYSDFAIHDMGDGLADGVSQGGAGGREFRTAPLWGVGQRIFFLHDGRTNDLEVAIAQHASRGSEANQVIQNYNALAGSDQQALLNFLRSL